MLPFSLGEFRQLRGHTGNAEESYAEWLGWGTLPQAGRQPDVQSAQVYNHDQILLRDVVGLSGVRNIGGLRALERELSTFAAAPAGARCVLLTMDRLPLDTGLIRHVHAADFLAGRRI